MKKKFDHAVSIGVLLGLVSVLFLISCSPSLVHYKEVGRRGKIDSAANVRGFASVEIKASVQTVWETLVQAKEWPSWNPEIKSVQLEGPLTFGKRFIWGPAFPKIKSEVVLCIPQNRVLWVGTMLQIKAIHSWELKEKSGMTVVTTEESLDGIFVTWVFGKKKLNKNLNIWLGSLKTRAEWNELNRAPDSNRVITNE